MKKTRHKIFSTKSCAFVLATAALSLNLVHAHEDVTFTTWTGPYMKSQMLGFVNPYQDQTGKIVNVAHYAGGIDEIRDQVESANIKWDVIDLTQADSIRACEEGLLEKIDHSSLPNGANGASYKDDFVEGALNPCGVGVIVWGTIFAYDNNAFTDSAPAQIADFFDMKNFPGKRAIRKDPAVIMEWALLADGVPANEIYSSLETEEGIARAFTKLDEIKANIVWWKNGRDPIRLLNNSEVAMSSIWATTGAVGSKEEGANFTVEWDGRVIEMDLFGIVKGTSKKAEALEFIKFASSSKSLADQAKYLANGPTRKSSMALISKDIRDQLPNAPMHDDKASVVSDASWWAQNHAAISEKFDVWAQEATQKGASGTVR